MVRSIGSLPRDGGNSQTGASLIFEWICWRLNSVNAARLYLQEMNTALPKPNDSLFIKINQITSITTPWRTRNDELAYRSLHSGDRREDETP